MPDPMKNTDIEDVLSSIRRLVSYDPANLKPVEPAPAARSERLVLTPALRVQAAEQPVETAPQATPEGAVDTPAAEAPQPTFIHRAEAPVEQSTPAVAGLSLEDRIADLEVAVSQTGEEWEPDGSEAEANVYPTACPVIEPPRRPRMHLSEPEAARAAAPAPEEPMADDPPVTAAPPLVARDTTVQQRIEEVALDEGVDALMGAADSIAGKAAAAMPAAGADDQAVLRDLVRQIIREEFQGALGERITRNVRKLVRREINRALVSKEFE